MKKIVSKIKNKISSIIFKPKTLEQIFEQHYKTFLKTGKTPPEGYNTLLGLYCESNGKFNEKINKEIKIKNPPNKIIAPLEGIIGNFNSKEYETINETLNKNGYVFFDKKLTQETLTELTAFALKTPTKTAPLYDQAIIYNPAHPVSEIYRFDMQDLINNESIQNLIMDPALINVARNYLGCEPIFDFPAMWWSTAFLKEASSEAAQLYHFDLDRIKWLKIFIYVNDVTPLNGPHCYIRGSHLPDAKPQDIINRGYARIPDADLLKHYKKEDFMEVCAPAGTVFAGDTKCFHKGTPLKKGDRLVLEFEYTSSMFGANYPKLKIKNSSKVFKQFCLTNKSYASNFEFDV